MLIEHREKLKEAVPSKVLFNHIFAINYNIQADSERYKLKNIPYFNSLKLLNISCNNEYLTKLLWNSWSTEYAYNLGTQLNNDDYYKFALHWNFPQAYYSVYLAMTAFHETQGIANDNHDSSINKFGNSVKDQHYPRAISFHSLGLHNEFRYNCLDTFKNIPNYYYGLKRIDSLDDAQTQIALFLKTTRINNAVHKREKLKGKDSKKFLNGKSELRKRFNKEHWDLIYQSMPVTTILNLLYRLRIKANYHDVEAFIHAEIDFRTFHECLGGIIEHLNFVHESYIVKVIGNVEYEKILFKYPNHLNKTTAIKRYNEYIK